MLHISICCEFYGFFYFVKRKNLLVHNELVRSMKDYLIWQIQCWHVLHFILLHLIISSLNLASLLVAY